jgi:hypothetical protein
MCKLRWRSPNKNSHKSQSQIDEVLKVYYQFYILSSYLDVHKRIGLYIVNYYLLCSFFLSHTEVAQKNIRDILNTLNLTKENVASHLWLFFKSLLNIFYNIYCIMLMLLSGPMAHYRTKDWVTSRLNVRHTI